MGAFADVRADVAAALTGLAPSWTVIPAPVDALSAPAFLIEWGDPWVPAKSGPCRYETTITVRAVVARVDPDPGIELLELMVEAAVAALDRARFPVRTVAPPRPFTIGNMAYLSATITTGITVALTVPEPTPAEGIAAFLARADLVAAGAAVPSSVAAGAAAFLASADLAAVGAARPTATIDGAATMTATAELDVTGGIVAIPWTPASLPTLVGWWDASDLATITAAAGLVSQWTDKSGLGHHGTQGTSTLQPTTGIATIGGKNAIRWDGTRRLNDVVGVTTTYIKPPALTIAAVVKYSGTNFGPVIGSDGNGLTYRYGMNLVSPGNFNIASSTTPVGTTAPHGVAATRVDAGAYAFYLDGVADGAGTNASVWVDGGNAAMQLGNGMEGDIGEIVYCNSVLSATDLGKLAQYFRAKWGTP